MDIFWVQFGGGDPVSLLKKYGNRWQLLHLKNMRKGTVKDLTGNTSTENDVPLGTGEIDIPGILKAAKKLVSNIILLKMKATPLCKTCHKVILI